MDGPPCSPWSIPYSTCYGDGMALVARKAPSPRLWCGYAMQDDVHAAMWLCGVLYFVGFLLTFSLAPCQTGTD